MADIQTLLNPALTKSTGDMFRPNEKQLKIVVGPGEDVFYAHRHILIKNSDFYKAMLKPRSNFVEARSDTLILPEANGSSFSLWLYWAYSGTIPTYAMDAEFSSDLTEDEDAGDVNPSARPSSKDGPVQGARPRPAFFNLIRLHRLADFLGSEGCHNAVLDLIAGMGLTNLLPTANDVSELWSNEPVTGSIADFVAADRTKTKSLRDLVRDMFSSSNFATLIFEEQDSWPERFLRELLVAERKGTKTVSVERAEAAGDGPSKKKARRVSPWADPLLRCRAYHKHLSTPVCPDLTGAGELKAGEEGEGVKKVTKRKSGLALIT